jgi:hypothetical protein
MWVTGTSFKNGSNRKIRIGTKPAAMGLGGGCGNMTYNNLNPGESINIGGAYCPPFESSYTDNPPSPPPPSIIYANPKIQDGNYRIKNELGGYLYLKKCYLYGFEHYSTLCDSSVTATMEMAKWKVSVKNKVVAGSNEEETYIIESKPLGLFLFFEEENNALPMTPTGPESAYEIVRKSSSDIFFIKRRSYYHYVNVVNGKVDCTSILGFPINSQWTFEKCD